ncbi:MAG: hypothetical protein QM736_19310 [Vicinamibacterales bacterium]
MANTTSAKKTSGNVSTKAVSTNVVTTTPTPSPLSLENAHAMLVSMLTAPTAALAEVVTENEVTFMLTNSSCVATITSGNISFELSGTSSISHRFPAGTDPLSYAVVGPPDQTFAITVEGASFDTPITGRLSSRGHASGERTLIVV